MAETGRVQCRLPGMAETWQMQHLPAFPELCADAGTRTKGGELRARKEKTASRIRLVAVHPFRQSSFVPTAASDV